MEESRKNRPLRKVLFATHRSAASRAALLAVAGLAVGAGIEVIVLHVDDQGRPEEAEQFASDVAWKLLGLAVDAKAVVARVVPGRVAAAIAAAAAEHQADLVVLGSRGRSDLGGLLLGSVGDEVLRLAWCPVLVVRAGRRASARRRRVLVAIAGDEDLNELTRITAAVAEHDAQVLVLHLLAPDEGVLQLAASAELVERMVSGLRRCGVRARGRVRAGGRGVADEIASTAQGYGADLVIVGSRRLPSLAALLRGSVSHEGIRRDEGGVLIGAPGAAAAAREE
ncbi:MAG TPA: universal stress protein [Candidatus Dormibacteraeota bacterium]|nr:universal stress protein [Candidatus Dormibacteraeota bacterium]